MFGYLAQIAYKLRHLQISKNAAETLLNQFIEKNETRYRMLNTEKNPALFFKLKYSEINTISVTTIRQIIEAFLIMAGISKLQKPNFEHDPKNADSIQVRQTKLKLRICNFLLMALELSILLNNPILTKCCISEIFNHSLQFLTFDPRPEFLKTYLLYVHQSILTIPADQMDSSMRRIGSWIGYEVSKDHVYHLKDTENELYRKVLMTELAMDLRKWQTYSQVVTKLDQLTEEQLLKQKEQRALIEKGEQVNEADLIKDPQPYDVTETYCTEIEIEGKAYEEFLLMFKDEYTELRVEKWKAKLQKLAPKLTNGEEVVQNMIGDIDTTVNFWKSLKENPESQINNIALKEHPRFLEFTCKALQRVIELGQKSEKEINDIIATIKLEQEMLQDLEDNINNTKNNLSKDIVQRRQNRFNLIEEKVNQIADNSKESVHISMVDLSKLFNDIRKELASSDQFQKSEFSADKLRYFLQVGQFLFVKAMVSTLMKRKMYVYRHDTGLPAYQNIALLDFNDMINQANDFKLEMQSARNRIRNELVEKAENAENGNPPPAGEENELKIPEEDEIQVPVEERVKAISEVINLLSRSSQYSCVSKSWVLLENTVKYTWNMISYELISPIELSQTDAYKDIFLITECVLNLLSQAKLSDGKNEEVQAVAPEPPMPERTVRFADETVGNKFGPKIILNDTDLKFYSGFIAYTMQ